MLLGIQHRSPDQVDSDPEVPASHSVLDDEVEHCAADHAGIHRPPDPLLQDALYLLTAVGREVDLGGLEHGHDARIEDLLEVGVHVAHGEEYPASDAREPFIQPEDGVEDVVEDPFGLDEVRIVEADQEHLLPDDKGIADLVHQPPDGEPGGRGRVPEDPVEYPCEDHEVGVVELAIDVDRDHLPRGVRELVEDPFHARGLPRPRDPLEEQVDGAGPVQRGPDGKGQLVQLCFPVVELVRDMAWLADVPVPKERLVRHEQSVCHAQSCGLSGI